MHQDDIVKRVRDAHPEAVIGIVGADCNFEIAAQARGSARVEPPLSK